MVINPVFLHLADTLAAAVTWHKLYRHRVRNVLARTSFTSVILRDGIFSTLPSRVGVVEVMLMPVTFRSGLRRVRLHNRGDAPQACSDGHPGSVLSSVNLLKIVLLPL